MRRGTFHYGSARRMLRALHESIWTMEKSEDHLVIEAFLWRQMGYEDLASVVESARPERATMLMGTVDKEHGPWCWVRLDHPVDNEIVHEMACTKEPFNPGDRVRIVRMPDGVLVVVENVTAADRFKEIRGLG